MHCNVVFGAPALHYAMRLRSRTALRRHCLCSGSTSLHDAGDYFDVTLYQQAVGCLIYLCITRPDIQFAVSQMSRFMHCPGSKHWQAIKWIFCYLSGTRHLGFFIPRGDHCRYICMLFQILTGLVAMTHACPLAIFASCLVAHVYHD